MERTNGEKRMTKDIDGKTTLFANEEYEERAAILQYAYIDISLNVMQQCAF